MTMGISSKEERKELVIKHYELMKKEYGKEISCSISESIIYDNSHIFQRPEESIYSVFCFRNCDTVTALFEEAEEGKRAGVLNFASFHSPGGGFINGAMAQEEAICHESDLYNVLSACTDFYEYNIAHKNNGLYLNRALYSPDIIFVKDGVCKADVITCAAPDRSNLVRFKSFTEEENKNALLSRARLIRNIAEEKGIDILILGAWGCGVFKQDPKEVAEIFKDTFKETSIERVVYAVPGENRNASEFRKICEEIG